ncbi:MAG: HpcH/HpaI aldolase/citrate lyase family protein [Peptococcaceae bacterium]|nr:HpcH/HpaI aldolase/citrate lyase family protein [Peptococcaceae bacterium]
MKKDKLRRAMMFVPGNNPNMLQNSGIYGADSLIFDLEDTVSIPEKDSAPYLVAGVIKHVKFPCEVGVRINHLSTPWGRTDLETVLPSKPDFIRLPKAESAEEIKMIDEIISEVEYKCGFEPGSIELMAAIESPKGLRNAYEIATASPRMMGIAIGGEDFSTSLKTGKSLSGRELFVARSMVVFAAREADVFALDSVFSDIRDEETFTQEVIQAKEMGFDGKSCVNPKQVEIIYKIFTPSQKEIDHAHRVLEAYNEALEKKHGVISMNGKMIDAPMIIRAERVLANATAAGVYKREE